MQSHQVGYVLTRYLSRDARERKSRIDRLIDEFYDIANYPFFAYRKDVTCPICSITNGNEKTCHSLEKLSKHLLKEHEEIDADIILYAQEGILNILLKRKIVHDNNRSRFSN